MQMSIWLPPESSQSTDIKEILKKKLNKDKGRQQTTEVAFWNTGNSLTTGNYFD